MKNENHDKLIDNDIDLELLDWQEIIQTGLGNTEWVTVLAKSQVLEDIDSGGYFCALVSDKRTEEILKKYDWDLLYDQGRPGFVTHYEDGKGTTNYYRYTNEGIEPLVHWRFFSGTKESYYEINEEFRFYFNLFEKTLGENKKVFIATDDDGEDDEVIIMNEDDVKIKLKYIKEFLAIKKMCLAIYFEGMRFSKKTLEELNQSAIDNVVKGDKYIYSICVRNLDMGDRKSQGWLLGKKIIEGFENFKPKDWESKEDKFEEFIIGVDGNGREMTGSCDADYQSKPFFLTPVFFKREVLKKYYDSPDRFSVEDGYLRRNGFWGLRISNNSLDNVMVWLGDLKKLPFKEQSHWRGFNITPKKISHTDYARNINGEFTDPEHPELYFKYKFEEFQKIWIKKFGWYLFKPLSKDDMHHMKSLHIPTTIERKEFDEQVASLAKIIIDSLNEEELIKGVDLSQLKSGSINRFEMYLNSKHARFLGMIDFLRNVQELRSTSIAHRKSDNNKKYIAVKHYFDFEKKDLISIFDDILVKTIWMLNSLEKHFLTKD